MIILTWKKLIVTNNEKFQQETINIFDTETINKELVKLRSIIDRSALGIHYAL